MTTQNITETAAFSTDPNHAMQEMMETIDKLRGIYIEETEALEKTDTYKFLELQDAKLEAARLYQSGISHIIARKEEMKAADPALKARLIEMQSQFAELAKRNIAAIQRMQRSTEQLGNTIRKAARDAARKANTVNYRESGEINMREGKALSMGISETA